MNTVTVGRVVNYVVNGGDGTLQVRPAVVVRVWSEKCVNLQILQDGNEPNLLWRTSRLYADATDGLQLETWHWPEVKDEGAVTNGTDVTNATNGTNRTDAAVGAAQAAGAATGGGGAVGAAQAAGAAEGTGALDQKRLGYVRGNLDTIVTAAQKLAAFLDNGRIVTPNATDTQIVAQYIGACANMAKDVKAVLGA